MTCYPNSRRTIAIISLIVIVSIFSSGCFIRPEIQRETADIAPTPFEGRWEWVQTCGGITGGCSTAAEAGYSAFVSFEGDRYHQWKEGHFDVNRTVYQFELVEKPMCGEPATVVTYDGVDQFSLQLMGDTLIVRTGCADGTASYYVRRL